MTKSEKTLEEKITVADLLKACDQWYAEPETAKRIIHDAYMCAVSDYLTAQTMKLQAQMEANCERRLA